MARLLFLCIVTSTFVCKALGGNVSITAKFMYGDVLFIWSESSSNGYNVSIPIDTTQREWIYVTDSRCTVKNALLYESISISVYHSNGQKYGDATYYVDFVVSRRGITTTLSWSAPFFPVSGMYTIYHTNIVNKTIIEVSSKNATVLEKGKYHFVSPYNSTDIAFEIRNITLNDAGYYAGGVTSEAAWLEGGRILIVKEEPLQPKIGGNLTVTLDSHIELHCLSEQISAPAYHAKLTPLYYMWFVNGSQIQKSSNKTLSFPVTKSHRYNKYSCVAADTLLSNQSDVVQINVLYGPEKLTINPNPNLNNNNDVTKREGQIIGPYSCSADCNPPCEVTWQYVDIDGNGHNVTSSVATATLQTTVHRNISQFSCVGTYESSVKKTQNISLDIQYLDEPLAYVNSRLVLGDSTESMPENTSLYLSCYANGKPNPTIRLNVGMDIASKMNQQKWLNHTIEHVQCNDTGTYKCECESAGFVSKVKTFRVSVLCKPRLDTSYKITTHYLSESGPNVIVSVDVPLISNPAPGESEIKWSGPIENNGIKSTVQKTGVPYRHLIRGSIPIRDGSYFGNYTMKYNGEEMITISILFHEQFAGDQRSRTGGANSTVIALGSSVVAAVVILAVTVLVASHFFKRKKVEVKRKSLMLEGMLVPEENNEPMAVYAVVQKSPLNVQRNKKDVRIDDSSNGEIDGNEMYENTTKEAAIIAKQKGNMKKQKKQKHKSSSAEPTVRESASGFENQDKLIYIDVDFADESGNLETNGEPKIHGDEDRTEYTFVDFSKKAQPAQENEDKHAAKD